MLKKDTFILADFESAGRDGDLIPDDMLKVTALDPLVVSDSRHVYDPGMICTNLVD